MMKLLKIQLKFCSAKNIVIPKEKLECRYCRSSGPGGQHVNKTNSKAEIRFNLMEADWLQEVQKTKFMQRFPNFVNKDGEVVITSQISREQNQNLNYAIDKLKEMVFESSRPEKAAFIIPPVSDYKIKQRIETKRHRSDVKKNRSCK